MLRSVPGRVHRLQLDVADAEPVTVAQQARVRLGREGVSPVVAPFIGEEQLRIRALRPARARR